jgi:DNA-binding transcriptional MerR regulator
MIDAHWNQSQVARFFNVTPRTISNWLRQGRLPPPATLPNGWRAWPESVIRSLVKPAERHAA